MVILKGIGENVVKSNMQILARVQISQFHLEILFHVVNNNYLKYDVMIGREILQLDFGMTIDSDKLSLFKTKTVNVVQKESTAEIMLKAVNNNVDLSKQDKQTLINVLEQYSDNFINEIPQRRVTTGSWCKSDYYII